MDPRRSIRNGFANGYLSPVTPTSNHTLSFTLPPHSHFYAAWTSRHQSSMIPKALKIATLQKKNAPIPPHT